MALVKPFSLGNVTLRSASPYDLPAITTNFLTHPVDREVAVAAFRIARQILNSPAMRPLLADPSTPELLPGPSVSSDAEILDWMAENFSAFGHVVRTCEMGMSDDLSTILDAKARVKGVERLRVVDASSFPVLPPGHPQATVYAFAEKIAADIIESAE
jgi:choline dehydrogenase